MPTIASHRRLPLARKLSLLTGSVIALCLAVALAVVDRMLTRSTIAGMQDRLTRSTEQLASIAQNGVRQGLPRYAAIARDSAVLHAIEAFQRPSGSMGEASLAAARTALSRLELPGDSGMVVELWDAHGHRITYVGTGRALSATAPASLGNHPLLRESIEAASVTDSLRLSRLFVSAGHVYFWIVQRVVG